MKTILITGATGFLGSYLLHKLRANYRVIILKRSFSDTWRIDDILQDITSYDIDYVELKHVFEKNNIDIIIHTATSYGKKGETISDMADANFLFPLKLLELSLSANTSLFINTDTFFHQNINLYALSKKQFLEWLKQCNKRICVVNMKLEHMYGPGDNRSKFLVFLIRKMLQNDPLDLTEGEQKRDFIFIDDVANAYKKVLDRFSYEEPLFFEFEVGSGKSTSIRELVQLAYQLTESRSALNFGVLPYRENEIMESEADISALVNIGWKPVMSLRDGMASMTDYEKKIAAVSDS